jgi:ribosomal protein L33
VQGGGWVAATVCDGVYRRFEVEIGEQGSLPVWHKLIPSVNPSPVPCKSTSRNGWMSGLCIFNNPVAIKDGPIWRLKRSKGELKLAVHSAHDQRRRPYAQIRRPRAHIPRRILVKLVSTALTGFFYTTTRPRLGEKLAMMKYDPMGAW